MSVNEPHFVFYLQYSNKNTVTKFFFNADMAEHFRFELQLLEAEIQAPELLTFTDRITPYTGIRVHHYQSNNLPL